MRTLYVMPIPMLGVQIQLPLVVRGARACSERGAASRRVKHESENFTWGDVQYIASQPGGYCWRASLHVSSDGISFYASEKAAKRAVTGMLRELITDLQEVHK